MKALRGAALIAAPTFFLLLFVVVAALRMPYPYELEWMEGGALGHVGRVLAGSPLYVSPSLDFVPFIYTPLYFWVAAGASALLGEGFFPLRLVSVLSTLGCCALLFLLARREAASWRAGLLAAGLYAATFEASGVWMDLARVDALFMLCLLGGIYVARWSRGVVGLATAGGLLGLAFLTKQPGLIVALPVVAWTVFAQRGAARLAAPLAFALVAGGGALALHVVSGGWFTYYVFTLPGHHALIPSAVLSFWSSGLLRPLGWAVLATGVFLVGARREQALFYALVLVGLIGASFVSRIHTGSYLNALMPAYAGLALGFALGVDAMQRWAEQQGHRATAVLMVAVLVQFGALLYNPMRLVPTAEDRAAGDRLVEILRDVPGEVLVLSHPYLAERVGKPPHAQEMALFDVWRGAPGDRDRIEALIQRAIRDRRYGAIVLDEPWWGTPDDFDAHYRLAGPVFDRPRVFLPTTGYPSRPEYLYLRRD
ncbi:MAG: glycosyltransferase family 39 protein [Rhodothermales bacterium]